MRPFDDSTPLLATPDALRERFRKDGYLFLRGLLPPAEVTVLRDEFVKVLDRFGWIADAADPARVVPTSLAQREAPGVGPEFFEPYTELQRSQRFHELAHHARLVGLAAELVQDELLVHPRKIGRVALPRDYVFMTAPHQDHRLIQGTGDVLTVWLPIGDCPDEVGGLAVLPGSQRRGLLPALAAPGVGGVKVDIEADFESPSTGWCSSDMAAGDVLIFHSLTVHAAKPNNSAGLRLSVDYRYQSAREPVAPGSLVPHAYPNVPGFDELTHGWTDRFSVTAPDRLVVSEPFDVFDPAIATPPSRIVDLDSTLSPVG